jgi:anti-anti-sigma factor
MGDGRADRTTVRPSDGATMVAVRGEIDLCCSPVVRRRLLDAAAVCSHDLVVDLTETAFLDCSGMAAIAAARDVLRKRKRALRLRGAHGVVARAIGKTDLVTLLADDPHRRSIPRRTGR